MEDLEEKIEYYHERVEHYQERLDNIESYTFERWNELQDSIHFDTYTDYLEHSREVIEESLDSHKEVLERLLDNQYDNEEGLYF